MSVAPAGPSRRVRLLDTITRQSAVVLKKLIKDGGISDNERDYLGYLTQLLNALLWSLTTHHPDYLDRGSFILHETLVVRASVSWLATVDAPQWVNRLRPLRDAVAHVVEDRPTDEDRALLPEVIRYLELTNALVHRAYFT